MEGPSFVLPTDFRLDELLSSPQVCPVPWERRKGPTHDLLCVFNLCDAWGLECDQYRTCDRIYPAMSSKFNRDFYPTRLRVTYVVDV